MAIRIGTSDQWDAVRRVISSTSTVSDATSAIVCASATLLLYSSDSVSSIFRTHLKSPILASLQLYSVQLWNVFNSYCTSQERSPVYNLQIPLRCPFPWGSLRFPACRQHSATERDIDRPSEACNRPSHTRQDPDRPISRVCYHTNSGKFGNRPPAESRNSAMRPSRWAKSVRPNLHWTAFESASGPPAQLNRVLAH